MIFRKGKADLDRMRRANEIVADVLDHLGTLVAPGVSTLDLDEVAEKMILEAGGTPAFKGYRGYPATLCTSINNEIVHGIPRRDKRVKEGDILSIDVGVRFEGFYGDSARTFPVGRIEEELQRLLDVTREALYVGIEKARLGNRVSDISAAIQAYVEANGFSVVREFVGHGIGRALHEEPQIPNFGVPGRGPRLAEGMVLAIEPMVNSKGSGARVLEDSWTAVTEDGGFSAHFEHSVAVTSNGPWILSQRN
jgi:methionyl aminopeptidase